MAAYQIHVFISHSWSYSGHYEKLSEWIFDESWNSNGTPINFIDYSVPKDNPIHNADNATQLKNAIFGKIANSHVIVIPTGMYAEYSYWIQKEIDGASPLNHNKPILAVNPWGQEKKSTTVIDNSTEQAGWRKQSVIDKIWGLYLANR